MRVTRSSSDATLMAFNLKDSAELPILEEAILILGIDHTNDKSEMVNALAADYIKRNDVVQSAKLFHRRVADDITSNFIYEISTVGSDNNIPNDVARVVYLSKICNNAKKIKFIFTLTSSIITEQNVEKFKEYLKVALLFFNNIDKFSNGISLIITQSKDDQIRNACGKFLEKVKASSDDKKMSKFLEIVTQKNDKGEYENLEISKTTNTLEDLKAIGTLIYDNTLFENSSPNDFNFNNYQTLFTKEYVSLFQEVSKRFSDEIEEICATIAQQIISRYRRKFQNSRDYQKLGEELTELSEILNENIQEMSDVSEYMDFTKHLMEIIMHVDPHMNYKQGEKILELTRSLQAFSNWYDRQTLRIDPKRWAKKISDCKERIDQDKNTCKLVNHMIEIANKYEFRTNVKKYTSKRCKPIPNTVGVICDSVRRDFPIDFSYTKNLPLTTKRKELVDFVKDEYFVEDKLSIEYNDDNLVVRGSYIKLKDIPIKDKKYKGCKILAILASKKIFIDADIEGTGMSVIMIAPKWEVIGKKREIILNGKKAPPLEKNKAENGVKYEEKGQDGEPGNVGEAGGNFYGFAKEVINGSKLRVKSNGGQGGDGMEGGDGGPGKDGESIKKPENPDKCYDYKQVKNSKGILFKPDTCSGCTERKYCLIGKGANPTNGGAGGTGGAAGAGGPPGEIEMFLVDNHGIKFAKSSGKTGKPGVGGKGGKGGKGNEIMCVECTWKYNIKVYWDYWYEVRKTYSGKEGGLGEPGKVGSDKPITVDSKKKENHDVNVADYIEKFKSHLRESMADNYVERGLVIDFYDMLVKDANIRKFYKALDYIKAAESLENQFKVLKKDKGLITHFYSILLNAVQKYTDKLQKKLNKKNKQSKGKSGKRNKQLINQCRGDATKICDEIKALTHLYAMLTSKLMFIKNNSPVNLVSDLKSYLMVKIDEQAQLQIALQQHIINYATGNYTNTINSQIKEAEGIVQGGLMSEIDKAHEGISKQMDNLLEEVFKMEKNTVEKKKELEKKKKELEQQMTLNIIFGVLKGISTILSFCGPIGAVAGSVLGMGTGIAENFLGAESGDVPGMMEGLPDQISNTIDSMDKYYDEKVKARCDAWNEGIDKIIDTAKPDSKNDKNALVERLEKQKQELNDAVNEGDLEKVAECESKIKDTLKGENIDGLTTKVSSNTKAKIQKAADYFEKATKVFEHATDIYNKYKDDAGKIEEVDKAINKCEEDMGKLKNYRDQINQSLMPMMGKMRNDLKHSMTALGGNSKPKLAFEQYKVHKKLTEMRGLLTEFVLPQPEQIKRKLTECIDQMVEVMDTVIHIYQQIESLKERQEEADLIAIINTRDTRYSKIKDKALKDAIQSLDVMTRTNYIYQCKAETLKHYIFRVFPHFEHYLAGYPPNQVPDPDIIDFNEMRNKIIEYDSKLTSIDTHTHCGKYKFGKSTKPFYVWRNHLYKDKFSNLLQLRKTVLTANIHETSQNVVKFTRVYLKIYTDDEATNEKLQHLLDYFQINMHHSGINHYKCNGKHYMIHSEPQTITYKHQMENGKHVETNQVYDKMMEGDVLLSPYTTWTFQILNATNIKGERDLLEYKDSINIALVGEGCYLDDSTTACETMEDYLDDIKLIDEGEKQFFHQIDDIEESIARRKRSLTAVDKSSVSGLVNWTTGKLKSLISNTIDSIQSSFQWVTETPTATNHSLLLATQHSNANQQVGHAYQYDVNGTLFLTNYLIRKLTGEKFVNATENEAEMFHDNQIKAMTMTNYVENVINELFNGVDKQNGSGLRNFDPVKLQKEILLLLNTGRQEDIGVVIETFAKDIFDGEDLEKFRNVIMQEVSV